MSLFLQLGDDSFHHLLSWLDLICICKLDTAIGNENERLLWLHTLHTMDSVAVDECDHSHSSVRWLITRGARATRIRIKQRSLECNGITDETFAGVCILSSQGTHTDDSDFTLNTDRANTSWGSWGPITESYRSENRNIRIDIETYASVRPRGFHNLTSIDLSYCKKLSDIGLVAIAEGCHYLTSINLTYCHSISDEGVSAIAEGCHNLNSIDLSHCDSISDKGLSALAVGCHDLQLINFSHCRRISDIGVTAIAEGCHQLKSISLYYCVNISDKGLSALAESCRHLTLIDLFKCASITDVGLSALAEGCRDLEWINLTYCNRISETGLIVLAEGCHQLYSVNLECCNVISPLFISTYRTRYPRLIVYCSSVDDALFDN